jgi:hypothetical protein
MEQNKDLDEDEGQDDEHLYNSSILGTSICDDEDVYFRHHITLFLAPVYSRSLQKVGNGLGCGGLLG